MEKKNLSNGNRPLFIFWPVRAYLSLRRWLDACFLDRALIRLFNGVHPKNIFNYRHEFFFENVGPGDVVIDAGCGTGFILSKIASRIKKGYGLDYDQRLTEYWKAFAHGENVEPVLADLSTFDFASFRSKTRYNVCIVSHILEHIEDVPSFLKRIGADRLLICVPSQENWRAQLLIHFGLPYLTDPTHYREYTRSMLRDELERAGYRPVLMGFNAEGEIVCRAEKT
jgi:SAM-dependent methyltransferase